MGAQVICLRGICEFYKSPSVRTIKRYPAMSSGDEVDVVKGDRKREAMDILKGMKKNDGEKKGAWIKRIVKDPENRAHAKRGIAAAKERKNGTGGNNNILLLIVGAAAAAVGAILLFQAMSE